MGIRLSVVALLAAAFVLTGTGNVFSAENHPLSKEERLQQGEKMYRDGIFPSGEPIKAFVSGDVPVDGSAFTCVSCHLRSGLGSVEGEVITPPTNGRILYEKREPFIKGAEFVPSYANYAKYLPVRPAYTDKTLATLIDSGIDPTGRSVLRVMPRYEIVGTDMDILIEYLKSLSDKLPPGVDKTHLKFATVIVEGTDPKKVESMLKPLQFTVDRKNALTKASGANDRVARMGYNMLGDLSFMTFSLDKWVLKGPPETWRAQLDAYYQANPVYALLGGISEGEWGPVHRFCEEMKIPDLFPSVDYPVISNTDWYTLYPSRGIRQEGESAARYLKSMAELIKDKPVVQVYRDNRRGQTLADGFRSIWKESGNSLAGDIALPEGEKLDAKKLKQIVQKDKPAVLLIWDEPGLLASLEKLNKQKDKPAMVIASGTWLGDNLWTIPEALRKWVYLTWPYRMPQEDIRFDNEVRKVAVGKGMKYYDPIVLRQAFIAQEMLGKALMEMRSEYYRDFLLDTIGMMEDVYLPLYERLSFGPGQRYASKGCFIVQLGAGNSPQLERRSEWVMP